METFSYIVGVVGIVCLVISIFIFRDRQGKCEDVEKCNLKYCNRLQTRDFLYCVGILVLFIIFISTVKLSGQKDISDAISFGSTITSIILSVLAIIMTLLAESKSENTKTRIENFIQELNTATSVAKEQVEKLEGISVKIDEIKNKQDSIQKALDEGIKPRSLKRESNNTAWTNSKYNDKGNRRSNNHDSK